MCRAGGPGRGLSSSQQQSLEDRGLGQRGRESMRGLEGAGSPVLATWIGLALEIYCTVLEEAWD